MDMDRSTGRQIRNSTKVCSWPRSVENGIDPHLINFFPETLGTELPASFHMLSAPIRVLVAEPDAASRKLICSLVECEPEMTAVCVDDSRLVSSMQESAQDLVILDAQIPAIQRVESWNALGIKPPVATIVTAHDPGALAAFASIAIDLLIKPFDIDRFETALARAKSRITHTRTSPQADKQANEPRPPLRQFIQRLAVETGEKIMLVRVEDIQWMQASGNHIRLHVGNTSHLLRQSLKNLQAVLDPNRFLRVHRNAIVNLDHVEEFHLPPSGNMFVKLNNGMCLPLRKGNRATLRQILKRIS